MQNKCNTYLPFGPTKLAKIQKMNIQVDESVENEHFYTVCGSLS